MKNRISTLFVMAVVMIAFSTDAFGQASATSTATATIVTPISIANNVAMNFGNVAVSASLGTVILASDGTRSITGGVTLPATAGTVSAARFTVTGTPGYTYAITLPSVATTVTSGSDNMTVDTFTNSLGATGTIGGGGTQTFDVGATLHVAANQPSGTYLSGTPFTVTVNYN